MTCSFSSKNIHKLLYTITENETHLIKSIVWLIKTKLCKQFFTLNTYNKPFPYH